MAVIMDVASSSSTSASQANPASAALPPTYDQATYDQVEKTQLGPKEREWPALTFAPTQHQVSVPVVVKLQPPEELPNGMYCEPGPTSKTHFLNCLEGTLYSDVIDFVEKANNVPAVRFCVFVVEREWKVIDMKFKGGRVDLSRPASEGSHTAIFGKVDHNHCQCCCVVS